MTFDQALPWLREGTRITRRGWSGKDMWLGIYQPDSDQSIVAMTSEFIYLRTSTGERVPWTASQTDILAIDWWVL